MKNKEVAKLLYEIAELLSLAGENPFKIRAYERGSQTIDSLTGDIEELAREGKLQEIPGIGEGMSEKITEYLKTGHLKYIDELKKNFPEGLLEIMAIPGIGPKKAKIMYDKLKISSVSELRKAAKEGRLRDLPGFAEKTEQNILGGIELKEKAKGRILLSDALRTADDIVSYLKKYKEVINIEPAGSLRRRKETIGDIDILCTVEKGREKFIIDKFTSIPGIQKVVAAGSTKASIISEDGMQVDLRVIESASYGAALQYFTGSKEHNIALRELANKKGYTINE
ncbi:MAG: helix-hairpin-helix domain-containing protein, partial [Elusimicrobiota bacterium]